MLVQKVLELNPMVHALILMSASRILKVVDMMQFVLTLKEGLHANVLLVIAVMLSMVCVHLLNVVVPQTKNAVLTRSAFNLANVFVHHHFSLIQETSAEVHVKDSLVESMPSVVQLIHLNVCVKQVSRVIHCRVALALTSVQMHHVPMELNVLAKKVVTNVYAPRECLAMHTRAAVFLKIQSEANQSAQQIPIVLQIFIAVTVLVSAHVLIYSAVQTLSVNQKIMLDGVDVESDSQKDQMETVFLVRFLKIFSMKNNNLILHLFNFQNAKDLSALKELCVL